MPARGRNYDPRGEFLSGAGRCAREQADSNHASRRDPGGLRSVDTGKGYAAADVFTFVASRPSAE